MTDTWTRRRRRAAEWLARECPAEQMLELYLELVELQEPLYREALAPGWGAGAASGNGGPPSLDLSRLPAAELAPRFRRFLGDLAPAVTEVLGTALTALGEAGEAAQQQLLAGFLEGRGAAELAAELGCDEAQLLFFPRVFVQPIAEALAEGHGATTTDTAGTPPPAEEGEGACCPHCGWPPQVAVLEDTAERKGERRLVCSLCAAAWTFPRSTCPACGETDPEKLLLHVSDSLPHVRVEECQSCGRYIKGIDLRKDGTAVPLVEDLATVELDVWAAERGLAKVQPNLLGL